MPRQIDKDKTAVWVANLCAFRISHGTREGVIFEPSDPVQIKMDDWIASQAPVLVEVADPFGELPESPVVNESPLLDQATGKSVTGVGTGAEGTGNGDDVRKKAAEEAAAAKAAAKTDKK